MALGKTKILSEFSIDQNFNAKVHKLVRECESRTYAVFIRKSIMISTPTVLAIFSFALLRFWHI